MRTQMTLISMDNSCTQYNSGFWIAPLFMPLPLCTGGNIMPLPLGARDIMFLSCPSICPSICLSICLGSFPDISWKTHWSNDLWFGMPMYPDYLQNWFDYSHGLLIFLILAPLWHSDTGQIYDFQAFSWEHRAGMDDIWHADVSWPPSVLSKF